MLITFFRAIVLYLIVLVVMRLMGKREIGQMQPFELAISIMIADLAATPMAETGIPISNGIVPILGLLVMHLVISTLNIKSTKAREIICGKPRILIYRGKINEKELKPKYDSCVEGFIAMNSTYSNMGVFVVPDNAVNDSMKKYEYLTANYNVTDINEKNLSEKELSEICKENSNNTVIDFDSKMEIKENSNGLGAMVTFIGLYLGIIFLISCAAILALKELSESSDNVEKFNMLRKIGVDEKMINKALFRQIGIFFMFPLLVAIIHSVFGIKFCNFLLSSFGAANLVSSIIGVAIFIVAIYGGYFLVTYICSKNIIKEK